MNTLVEKLRAGIARAPYVNSDCETVILNDIIATRETMNQAADEIESLNKNLNSSGAAVQAAVIGLESISNHAIPSVLVIRESVRMLRSVFL